MSGKCRVTSIARLFVAVWELVLKPCQLAERLIQKKKKSHVSVPKISTHSILPPDTHTHTQQTWQPVKETRVCVCG